MNNYSLARLFLNNRNGHNELKFGALTNSNMKSSMMKLTFLFYERNPFLRKFGEVKLKFSVQE